MKVWIKNSEISNWAGFSQDHSKKIILNCSDHSRGTPERALQSVCARAIPIPSVPIEGLDKSEKETQGISPFLLFHLLLLRVYILKWKSTERERVHLQLSSSQVPSLSRLEIWAFPSTPLTEGYCFHHFRYVSTSVFRVLRSIFSCSFFFPPSPGKASVSGV